MKHIHWCLLTCIGNISEVSYHSNSGYCSIPASPAEECSTPNNIVKCCNGNLKCKRGISYHNDYHLETKFVPFIETPVNTIKKRNLQTSLKRSLHH